MRVFDRGNGFDDGAAPGTQLAALLGFLGLSLLAWAAFASVAVANIRGWYAALVPPPLAPNPLPSGFWWVLAGFHAAMALAAWRVWRHKLVTLRQRTAMSFWGWQLALGAAWPAAFFGLHSPMAALLLAAGFAVCGGATLWRFARLDRIAAVLLAPYSGFALCALYFSSGFWWLNH